MTGNPPLVNGSPDLKTVREIGLKQADYFHKGFLTNFDLQKRIPTVTYFVFFYQNAITETKQVEPLTLMVSTKSAHLLPDNSPEAFNGFYCTWNPVKFRWKHFTRCDLWPRFFCIDATLLCEFESDKVKINEFE